MSVDSQKMSVNAAENKSYEMNQLIKQLIYASAHGNTVTAMTEISASTAAPLAAK